MLKVCFKSLILICFLIYLPSHFSQAKEGHLLIVEIQIQGASSKDDYIKIFNPLKEGLDLSGYKLRKRSSTGRESSIRRFPEGTKITSRGYLIWANKNYASQIGAQLQSSATLAKNNSVALLNPQGEILDAVAWGDPSNPYKEGEVFPENPSKNQKLVRKKQGGEYLDTDNNSKDFRLEEKEKSTDNFENEIQGGEKQETSQIVSFSAPPKKTLENRPPIAEAGPDIFTLVGEKVQFDASNSSDPDNDNLVYFWNFGDGQTSKGIKVSHVYSFPGNYLVVLEVDDGHQKTRDTLKVTVYPEGVILSEIYPNPKGKDSGKEWIEIYNDNPFSINLEGYIIKIKSKKFVFPRNSFILGKSFLVIQPKMSLPNREGEIEFLYPDQSLIQKINYSKVKEGQSLVFFNNQFYFSDTPTPNQKNLLYVESQISQDSTSQQKSEREYKVQSLYPQPSKKDLELHHFEKINPTVTVEKSAKQSQKTSPEDQKMTPEKGQTKAKASFKAQVFQKGKNGSVILIFPLILGIISLFYVFLIKKPF